MDVTANAASGSVSSWEILPSRPLLDNQRRSHIGCYRPLDFSSSAGAIVRMLFVAPIDFRTQGLRYTCVRRLCKNYEPVQRKDIPWWTLLPAAKPGDGHEEVPISWQVGVQVLLVFPDFAPADRGSCRRLTGCQAPGADGVRHHRGLVPRLAQTKGITMFVALDCLSITYRGRRQGADVEPPQNLFCLRKIAE